MKLNFQIIYIQEALAREPPFSSLQHGKLSNLKAFLFQKFTHGWAVAGVYVFM